MPRANLDTHPMMGVDRGMSALGSLLVAVVQPSLSIPLRLRTSQNHPLDLIVVLAGAAAIASHPTTNTQIYC